MAVDELVRRITEKVGQRAVPRAKLKLPAPPQVQKLERQLKAAGIESTNRFFRRPLAEQVERVISERPLALNQIERAVAGWESEIELRRAIAAAGAHFVLVKGATAVVGANIGVLSEAQLRALTLLVAPFLKQPKQTASLLVSDVEAALGRGRDVASSAPLANANELVVETVVRLAGGAAQVVSVPQVVRALHGKLTARQVSDALLATTEEGHLELRPDSGVTLLTLEDAALCPRSPSGAPLSYVVPLHLGG